VGYLLFDKKLLKVASSIKVCGLKTQTSQMEECGRINRLKRIKIFKDLEVNLSVDKVSSNICIKVKMLLKPTNDMNNFLLLLY